MGASLAALLALSGQSVGAAVTYTIQDLGTGWNPTGINDSGYIVGNMADQGGASSIVTWQYGCSSNCLTNLGDFGSGWASVNGVNNLGQIVGGYRLADFSQHAFLYDSGGLNDLSTLGGQISEAFGINNFGQVVGQSYLQNGGYTAFIYQNGAMQDLGVSQVFNFSQAIDINDNGLVIGMANPQFGQWTLGMAIDTANNNGLTTINPSSANPGIYLSAVNGSGTVVGFEYGNNPQAFSYSGGQLTPLSGQYVSQAFDINDQGQSVGYASNAAGTGLYLNDGQSVAMWQDLIDQNLGWSMSAATGAFSINNAGQIVGVGSLNGVQHVFLMTPNSPNPVDMTPTDLELAKLSEAVYTNGAQDLSGFAYIQSDLGLGFGAAAFKRGNEIVVAFRGTDTPSFSADVLKDVAADISYVTGTPTPAMESYARQAAEFLAQVRASNPGLSITITGHSLGGALAQLVGNISGFKTVAFDAPGPAQLVGALADELASANNLSGGQNGSIRTFRLWGDQVSAVGSQIGGLTTLGPINGQNQLVLTFSEAYSNHKMPSIISALADNNTLRAGGLQGPTLNWINVILPTSVKVINGLDVFSLSFSALSLVDVGIDPVGAGGYTFVLANGSPSLHSLMLPNFDGISRYLVSTDAGGVLAESYLDPLTWFTFADDTNQFSFFGLDALGQKKDFRGSILFDLRFREDGLVNAELIAQPTNNSVPEPSTWLMLIFGFGLVGIGLRHHRGFSYSA